MRDEHQAGIGVQIARLREQQGWSQRALAKWVGIDQSAVSRIEAGRRRLSADELQRFADALHISADELLRGTPAAAPAAAPASRTARPRSAGPTRGQSFSSPASPETAWDDAAEGPRPFESRQGTVSASRLEVDAPPEPAASAMFLELGDLAGFDDLAESAAYSRAQRVSLDPVSGSVTSPRLLRLAGLPDEVAGVVRDWFDLRRLGTTREPAQPWSTGHSAEGKPERVPHASASLHPPVHAGDVLYDRVARFWRSELHVDPDDGPLPDLVPLLEDGYGAQVIVARVAPSGRALAQTVEERHAEAAAERPVAAAFTAGGVPFIFVNAARPVLLQRFALAHAFAHLALGHGDVVDRRIEWNRTIPPEAAANDFAEELLAPVRAVERWYERRSIPRSVRLEDLLELGNAFGISAWAALYRSRAAGRLQGKQFHILRGELERHEWQLLPRQAFLGGLKDSLARLTPGEALPPGAYGGPAVLRVPAAMRASALAGLQSGRLSLEAAAAALRLEPGALAAGARPAGPRIGAAGAAAPLRAHCSLQTAMRA